METLETLSLWAENVEAKLNRSSRIHTNKVYKRLVRYEIAEVKGKTKYDLLDIFGRSRRGVGHRAYAKKVRVATASVVSAGPELCVLVDGHKMRRVHPKYCRIEISEAGIVLHTSIGIFSKSSIAGRRIDIIESKMRELRVLGSRARDYYFLGVYDIQTQRKLYSFEF